ncbi:MAG: hypothetical protein NTX50_04915 [Candidatus Sumerlaeota bacterium]|nr:hypothetical protein [Candidatus Sumerlaeota bacterium]
MHIRWLQILTLTALMVWTSACSTHVRVLKKFSPRPADYPIFLTDGDIAEPYEVVATVKSPSYDDYEARERGEDFLRQNARSTGGDAVIWVKKEPLIEEHFGYHPTGTYRAGTQLVIAYYYTGTIVRYNRELMGRSAQPRAAAMK